MIEPHKIVRIDELNPHDTKITGTLKRPPELTLNRSKIKKWTHKIDFRGKGTAKMASEVRRDVVFAFGL